MITLNDKQIANKGMIEAFAQLQRIPPAWAVAVAMEESSLGLKMLSLTKAKGLFGDTSAAMMDVLNMCQYDPVVSASAGGAYLHVLLDRFKDIETATFHYPDPKDRDWYVKKVMDYMEEFKDD